MPLRLNFDKVADEYEATRRLPAAVLQGLAAQMADAFGAGSVLDAGVGTGRFASALAAEGCDVVGVDISERMLTHARRKDGVELVRGDLARLPFDDGAFDHVVTIHVLHLLPDWRDALREFRRVATTFLASTKETREVSLHGRYEEALRAMGWEPLRPGRDAKEYLESVPPTHRYPVISYRETIDGDALASLVARKSFTCQWDVPEDLHERAVAAVRDEFAGRRMSSTSTWELLVWRLDALVP